MKKILILFAILLLSSCSSTIFYKSRSQLDIIRAAVPNTKLYYPPGYDEFNSPYYYAYDTLNNIVYEVVTNTFNPGVKKVLTMKEYIIKND